MIPVNSTQFRRTVRLCNSQKISIFNMNQPFFSDIKMCQCHITTFRTCSPLVLLYLILFLRFFSPLWQFRIHILKLHLQYGGIHIWLYIRTINMSGDIEKNSGTSPIPCEKLLIFHRNLNSINENSYLSIHFPM